MAIIEQNWIMLLIVTVASLLVCWVGGCQKRFLAWILAGSLAALAFTVWVVNMSWLDLATATLVYGVMVIYCPLMWLIIRTTDRRREEAAH